LHSAATNKTDDNIGVVFCLLHKSKTIKQFNVHVQR